MSRTTCPKCHGQIPLGSLFCNICGAELVEETLVVNLNCADCGEVYPPGSAFCNHCGAPTSTEKAGGAYDRGRQIPPTTIGPAQPPGPTDEPDIANPSQSDAEPTPPGRNEKLCPVCTAHIHIEAIRCIHCHSDLRMIERSRRAHVPPGHTGTAIGSTCGGLVVLICLGLIIAMVLSVGAIVITCDEGSEGVLGIGRRDPSITIKQQRQRQP